MSERTRTPPDSEARRLVRDVVRPEILALTAYHVPPARGLVKLDAMENPYPLPPSLREAWLEALRGTELNRYPDACAEQLKERLRSAFEIPDAAAILVGNGSDEIIQLIEMAVAGPALAPVPTFVMYEMAARFVASDFVGVPLAEDFGLDRDAVLAAIERHRPGVVFIAYPNNPTGNLFDERSVQRLIEAAPGLVVIDEAYHAFAGRSMLHRLEEYPNLLVMRTLSKLGLAGLRLGFAAAHPAWIEQLDKVRMPYNVNVLTQVSVAFALDHLDVFMEQAARIKDQRGRVAAGLREAGYRCFPSETNFILFRSPRHGPEEIYRRLRDAGVLIRNLADSHPALAGCLRVTVGTAEENDRFLAALPRS